MRNFKTVFGAAFGFTSTSHLGAGSGGFLYRVEGGVWKLTGNF